MGQIQRRPGPGETVDLLRGSELRTRSTAGSGHAPPAGQAVDGPLLRRSSGVHPTTPRVVAFTPMVETAVRATSTRVGTMGTHRHKAKRDNSKIKVESAKVKGDMTKTRKPTPATSHGSASATEYEWHVTMAAKGMAERDNYPMPKSVTTPAAFYEIMAEAALEAAGLRGLLERVARAERELDHLQDALRNAESQTEAARHRVSAAAAVAEETAPAPAVPAPPPSATTPGPMTTPGPTSSEPITPVPAPEPTERGNRRRIPGLPAARHTLAATAHGAWAWNKKVVLRRPERVNCPQCGARHPVVYGGDPCLFCDTQLPRTGAETRDTDHPLAAA
jgi:hypothetical protein